MAARGRELQKQGFSRMPFAGARALASRPSNFRQANRHSGEAEGVGGCCDFQQAKEKLTDQPGVGISRPMHGPLEDLVHTPFPCQCNDYLNQRFGRIGA